MFVSAKYVRCGAGYVALDQQKSGNTKTSLKKRVKTFWCCHCNPKFSTSLRMKLIVVIPILIFIFITVTIAMAICVGIGTYVNLLNRIRE